MSTRVRTHCYSNQLHQSVTHQYGVRVIRTAVISANNVVDARRMGRGFEVRFFLCLKM